ncbi:YgaP family membrane protein [Rossellomorea vietnamensis]|uniref:YgaP family membrane protein n=1 Tax=Rossellomorea vietnamensis TaxID=218284 RepID=UPI003CEE62FC
MKVTQNIGIVNALIRITVGFTVLSWATAKLVKMPWRDSYLWMALLGGMKVGEGILRFCPITAIFENQMDSDSEAKGGKSMLNIASMLKGKKGENDSHQKIQDIDSDERNTDTPDLPYNPS